MWYFLFISIISWKCSNSVLCFVYFYDMLELFQQCGIFLFISIICWNCFNSVVFFVYFYHILELFQQCGIFCLFLSYVGTVSTVWYFLLISICWNCSNSVVFFAYFYHIFCFSLYQYVVIKFRNSIKRIPLHIRINRSNPPHVTACANPLSRLPTPYIAVFFILFWSGCSMRQRCYGSAMSLSTSVSHRSDNAHHC